MSLNDSELLADVDGQIDELQAAWEKDGAKAFESLVKERPEDFLKIAAVLIPDAVGKSLRNWLKSNRDVCVGEA